MTPLLDRLDKLVAALERAPDPAGAWLTAAELAELIGVSERSIRTWEQTGQLPPPARVGRLKKWNRAEVERHLSKTAR
jgi:excisionase family DNA binding protein